jgi:hypothetical protein
MDFALNMNFEAEYGYLLCWSLIKQLFLLCCPWVTSFLNIIHPLYIPPWISSPCLVTLWGDYNLFLYYIHLCQPPLDSIIIGGNTFGMPLLSYKLLQP